MDIFFRLLLAHLIGDYTLQTDYIAKWKRESFVGVIVHTTIFLFISVILLWDKLDKIWFKWQGWVCLLILYILHIIEDEYRAYNVRHSHKEDSIIFFLWDQFIHIIFIYLFSPTDNYTIEPLIVVLCIFVIGTHFLSVFILYLDRTFYNIDTAYVNFRIKYFYILLRFIVLILFLLPKNWYFVSLGVIPIFFYGFFKVKHLTKIGLVSNILITYGLGFLILIVLQRI